MQVKYGWTRVNRVYCKKVKALNGSLMDLNAGIIYNKFKIQAIFWRAFTFYSSSVITDAAKGRLQVALCLSGGCTVRMTSKC